MEDGNHQDRSQHRNRRFPLENSHQVSDIDYSDSIGVAVVSRIAARSDTDPLQLEPLSSVVNPDALESLFQPGTDGQIEFTYNGYRVVVHSDGAFDVTRVDG